MQLHKFATIILIKPAAPTFCLLNRDTVPPIAPAPLSFTVLWNPVRNIRVRADIQPGVEIEEHRRTLSRGDEQSLELSQRVRADNVALIACEQVTVGSFTYENVKVVEPEVGHHLLQLALTVSGTQDFACQQFIDYDLLWFVERPDGLSLLCGHAVKKIAASSTMERASERTAALRRHS